MFRNYFFINIKDAGFVYESLRIKTNRVIWDFCFHETNPRNESLENRPTKQIHDTNLSKTCLWNESMKRIFKVWICESGFVSPILKDLNRGFVSWPELSKIRAVFTNPTNPHESWRILSTIARNESLRIQAGGFANPNLKDSFRGFVSWNFFFQITRFVSFRKDSYTNPASLQKIHSNES